MTKENDVIDPDNTADPLTAEIAFFADGLVSRGYDPTIVAFRLVRIALRLVHSQGPDAAHEWTTDMGDLLRQQSEAYGAFLAEVMADRMN